MDYDDIDGEYTRLRANLQLGDGPDQRGDRTLEMVRSRNGAEATAAGEILDDEEMEMFGIDPDLQLEVDDTTFVEFYHESKRTAAVLADQLEIADGGD